MANERPTIFSFFSGAGFLDLGFEETGFEVAYVNEFHKPFLDAYQHSRAVLGHCVPRFGYDDRSIEDVAASDLLGGIETAHNEGNCFVSMAWAINPHRFSRLTHSLG